MTTLLILLVIWTSDKSVLYIPIRTDTPDISNNENLYMQIRKPNFYRNQVKIIYESIYLSRH